MPIQFLIQPHQKQHIFMNCAKKEQLFGGAKRGGKTVALCQKIIALSLTFPGNRGILIRQNLTDLKDSTLVTFEQVCPPGIIAQHHKNDRKYTFKNGSHFIYRGVGDLKELEKVKGVDTGWAACDEPSEIDLQTYLMILAQLNWVLPSGKRPPYMFLLACNPEPGWVKQRFPDYLGWDADKPSPILERGDRAFIPSLTRDNPGLPDGYIEFLLENFPEEWVHKYVNGSWEVSEGMVFKEWDRRIHVVDELPPLQTMDYYSSIDHATTGVVANIHMGITPSWDHFGVWEYYAKDKIISAHAAAIRDRLAWYSAQHTPPLRYQYTLIDPATNAKVQHNKELVAVRDIYADEGIHTIPAWNAIGAGLMRIQELLHVNPAHIHPLTGKLGSPRLFFHRSMKETCREMEELKRMVDANGNVTYKGTDHAIDNVRYIVNSRPRPPITTEQDEGAFDSTTRSIRRSHQRWARDWDATIRKAENPNEGGYFDYMRVR